MDQRDGTNRDLLVGLLALQNGLVDQDKLILAFRTWTRDRSRPIAEILAIQGAIDAGDRDLLEALAAKQIKRHGGDVEKSLAAIPAGISTRESLARIGDAALEHSLVRLGAGAPAKGADGAADADCTAAYSVGTPTSEGQRFHILRPHARGGLGAVFVALDEELHREVALKQIVDQHADDPVSRQRFVLEAEVTGGLEHPGIVPVYGLGTYSDGRPFYAMRFVRGDSLKEAIDEFHSNPGLRKDLGRRSLELRKLLGRLVDVCNAIGYAHGRGVLHRDIKPGNIIAGKHGETLVVDWGLAKALGQVEPGIDSGERALVPRSASGSSSTLPGSALGTPAYMSPEQSQGDLEHLGPRSDVYSLGATLYCLLTGKPPFEGELVDVVRSVQKGQFPPPRQLDASIDRALEAVCLKAMAVEPADRFSSPKALADDLERWMAGEPVSAWHEPWTRTLARWLSRHKVGVAAAAAAVLMALAGIGAVLAVQTRANGALRTANLDLAVANANVTRSNNELAASNERERARFALAQEAIRTFHSGVSDDILLKEGQFKALRTKLLRGAREFYRKLEGMLEGHQDRESRLALAKAYVEVGELTRQLDAFAESPEVFRRAIDLLESLARENPADPEPRRALAFGLRSLGTVESGFGRDDRALPLFGRSRDLLRTLSEASPSDAELRIEWAQAEMYLESSLAGNNRPPAERLEAVERARSILETGMGALPPSAALQSAIRDVYSSMASALQDAGRSQEALAAFARASELGETIYRANPSDPNIGHELARNLGNMGLCLSSVGRRADALEVYNRALEVFKAAAASNPTVVRLPAGSAWVTGLVAETLADLGRNDEALAALERALALREALIKANPAVVRNHEQVLRIYSKMHEIHRQAHRMPEMLAALKALVNTTATIVKLLPQNREYALYLAATWSDLAAAHTEMGSVALASSCFDEALAINRRLIAADPTSRDDRAALASTFRARGLAMEKLGRPTIAASDLRQSIIVVREITNPIPTDHYNMACYQSLLSRVLAKAGTASAAADSRAAADQAIISLEKAIAAGWRDVVRLRSDTDLEPIRSRADFRPILLNTGFPDNPTASGGSATLGDDKLDLEKEVRKFQGTWTFVSSETGGKKLPADELKGLILTFEGNKHTVKKGDEVIQVGTQKLDPSKPPKTIDVTMTEGPNKGKVMLGIYEIDGDMLKVCFDLQGKKRPMEFKSAPGSQTFVNVHKRVKK
jgi:serine/threonine-protein kinase